MESMKPLSREAPLRHKGPKSWPSKNGTREWQTMRFVKYDAYIIHASFWTTLYILYFVFMFLFFQSGHSSTECYFSLFLQKVLFIQKFKEFQNSKVFWNIHSCLTLSKIQQLQTPARPRVCSAARQSRVGSYSNNLGRRSAFPIGKELLFWSKGIWENRSSDLTVWNVGTDFSGPKDTHFQVKKNITSFAAELAWIDGFLQGFCEVLIRCDQREICLCCEFLVVFLFNYSKFTRLFPVKCWCLVGVIPNVLMFGWCLSHNLEV